MDSYLVCYDISDPKRLRKVARDCEDYGYRKHLSVLLCRHGTTQYVRLRTRLYDIIHLGADQVMFIPLCPRCVAGMEAMSRPADPPEKNDVVMVL